MSTTRRIFEYALYVIFSLGSLAAMYFALVQIGVTTWWLAIVCLLAGYFLTNFVYIFVHESGHLIGGFIGGFKFYSFNVLFIKFIKISGKLKVRLTFSRSIAGYCQMIPPCNDNLAKSFLKFVRGSFVASCLYLVCTLLFMLSPFVFPEVFAGKFVLYALIAPAFLAALPTHISNFSPMVPNPTTDGAVMRGLINNSSSSKTQVKMLTIQGLLFSGTRPADLSDILFENLNFTDDTIMYAPLFESYKLSMALDRKDFDTVISSSDYIKANYKKTVEVFHKLLLSDVFYTELVFKKDIEEAERLYYYVASFLNGHTDISTLRVRMAKEIYMDKSYSQALNTGVLAKNLASSYEAKGGAIMECEIIDELSNIARELKKEQFENMEVDFKAIDVMGEK